MGCKARESAKATSLAFVLLDFQHKWVSEEECSVLQSQASGSICMLTIPSTSSRTIAWTHKNVYCTHWYSGSGTVAGMGSTAPRYGCCCTAITTTTTTTITATTTTDQPYPGKVINMSC